METLNKTLNKRGKIYGDYGEALECKVAIQDAILTRYKQTNGIEMGVDDLMLFQDIIGKLSRLASSPRHLDSWHDLAGYSTLIEKVITDGSK